MLFYFHDSQAGMRKNLPLPCKPMAIAHLFPMMGQACSKTVLLLTGILRTQTNRAGS